jgi:D-serine deaminase-like pyridoxal phosphate-dependent protein
MASKYWYEVENANEYDSPALLVFPSRIKENIRRLVEKVKPEFLRPHVKTNKTAEVSILMQEAGINKFKAATIAEAEMLAGIKASDVLLAYPPTIPKIKRLIRLIQKYPATNFSCLVDHVDTAKALSALFSEAKEQANVFIDLNVGMNRTGVLPENAIDLYRQIISLPGLMVRGLHAYDGHIRDRDLAIRTQNCHRAFAPVLSLKKELEKTAGHLLTLVAGGSPTSFIHAETAERECSPGTFIFWDKGYAEQLPEQPFEWAAVLLCRVISIPTTDLICIDLGYKSVASENPLPRVYFLNAPEATPIAQSEEHLVLKVPDAGKYCPGDILYGIPWHICPTVALFEKIGVVNNYRISGFWNVTARNREITI